MSLLFGGGANVRVSSTKTILRLVRRVRGRTGGSSPDFASKDICCSGYSCQVERRDALEACKRHLYLSLKGDDDGEGGWRWLAL
eukprot:757955-Hanusia_phi.AAC.3